jgi:NitT/TauT family transport system permease protein
LAAHSRYLPTPIDVTSAFIAELLSGALLTNLGATLGRVVAAFAIAMLAGSALGLWLGLRAAANRFFDTWLIIALNIPALVTIVFCYLWIGINETAAILAVAINKFPSVAVTLREGARSLDPALTDVSKAFRFGRGKHFIHIVWPQLEPYVASAVRNGLALIWKIVLVVELLGRSNGVGFQINLYFGLFDLSRIMAYAFSFMAIVMAIETFLVKPWEAKARLWRSDT